MKKIHSLLIILIFSGCIGSDKTLRIEREKVTNAVQKMGGGGKSFVVVHGEDGNSHNRIKINFSGSPKVTDDLLANLIGLGGIVELDLSETNISDRGIRVLTTLPNLEFLKINDTLISDSGLLELSECPKLKRLDVRRTKVTLDETDILKRFPKLEVINEDQKP